MKYFMTGNHAVATAVRLCRPQVVAAYPITPQTPIYEKLSDWEAEGKLGGKMMRVESEHSAMAACLSASLTGVRTFTATSSQGLALMHEMLFIAARCICPPDSLTPRGPTGVSRPFSNSVTSCSITA